MKIKNDIVLKNMLKSSSFGIDEIVSGYCREQDYSKRKPAQAAKHLGIEVECFGPHRREHLAKLLFMFELAEYVQIGRDGSIRVPLKHYAYELRILIKETDLKKIMPKIGKFFTAAKLQVNNSCGLHVHLDMRNRKPQECYKRLLACQDVLFGLVSKERWTNDYCKRVNQKYDRYDKYRAFTLSPYSQKKTLEVRLHHGSVDVAKITNWVLLLIKIVNNAEVKKMDSLERLLKWRPVAPLKKYIKANFNNEWFEKKKALEEEKARREAERLRLAAIRAQQAVEQAQRDLQRARALANG